MGDSGTLGACPLCGSPIEPFGEMRQRFVAEDLGGDDICVDCARKVVPEQVALAETLEREMANRRRGS